MAKTADIIVAMSGGVDSSVAALLLKQQGYQVAGMFMKNWEEDDTEEYCSAKKDLDDAQAVCDALEIPLHKVNFSAEYWDRVFERFLKEYSLGRTPNPDIWCNKEIKFKAFLEYARSLGAAKMATGHYAQIHFDGQQYSLLRGLDTSKDQSYFLYTLQQPQLAASLFPIGHLEKITVRKFAAEAGFLNSQKKDSTGICFIGERKFRDFLKKYLPAQPGSIKTLEGLEVGQHQGLIYYTLGQRQGLGIGGVRGVEEQPWYVIEKNLKDNILYVAQGHEHPKLFHSELECNEYSFVHGSIPSKNEFLCSAKIRYRQADHACRVKFISDDKLHIIFDEPQWAITEGQSIVFYQGEICLGGGLISHVIR